MRDQSSPRPLEPPTPDDRPLWDVWLAAYHFPTLTVADEIGLFPALAESPATSEELADRLGVGPRGAEALLAVLAGLGFLARHGGRFRLTAVARTYLLPQSPFYYGGLLRNPEERIAFHDVLRDALRTDRPWEATGQSALTSEWTAGEMSPDRAEAFTAMMHCTAFPAAFGVARRGDFGGVRRLLDVAGGSGCFCIALALRHPTMRFTLLELPAVCAVADRYVARYGLEDRIETVAANMLVDPWPAGHDAVFFSNVFHDWDRPTCLQLARRSHRALPPGGRIYLHEMLLADAKDGPLASATMSLGMVMATQGKQFTFGELSELLHEAGFADVTTTPTHGDFSLVSAKKSE